MEKSYFLEKIFSVPVKGSGNANGLEVMIEAILEKMI